MTEAKAKKAEPKKLTKRQRAAQLAKAINKEMDGSGSIMFAEDYVSSHMLRRPFGLHSLDVEIGGGAHAAALTTISGPPGVGKSLLAMQAAAQIQHNYGEDACIAYATNEGPVAKDLARLAGAAAGASPVEIDQIVKIRADHGLRPLTKQEKENLERRVGVFQQVVADTGEDMLGVVLKLVKSGLYQLVVIDSLTNMVSQVLKDADLGDRTVMDKAGLVTRFSMKLTNALLMNTPEGDPNETSVIGIKQMRANLSGARFAPPAKESLVAHALDHNRTLGIELGVERPIATGMGWKKQLHGKTVKWRIVKGKYDCHEGGTGSYDFYFDEGIDSLSDLIHLGVQAAVIRQAGAYYDIVDEDGKQLQRVKGKEALKHTLADDAKLRSAVRDVITHLMECVYRVT